MCRHAKWYCANAIDNVIFLAEKDLEMGLSVPFKIFGLVSFTLFSCWACPKD